MLTFVINCELFLRLTALAPKRGSSYHDFFHTCSDIEEPTLQNYRSLPPPYEQSTHSTLYPSSTITSDRSGNGQIHPQGNPPPVEMPAATASGANPTPNGNIPKSRDHNQGNQDRKYTVEQKTAVIRVRKCAPTAFYEILGCEKSVTDAEIKKAYRKLSLLTHPDKNGYDGADEAFKSECLLPRSTNGIRDGGGIVGKKIRLMGIAWICSGLESFPDPIGCGEEGEI